MTAYPHIRESGAQGDDRFHRGRVFRVGGRFVPTKRDQNFFGKLIFGRGSSIIAAVLCRVVRAEARMGDSRFS